jgi:hypothetical protein
MVPRQCIQDSSGTVHTCTTEQITCTSSPLTSHNRNPSLSLSLSFSLSLSSLLSLSLALSLQALRDFNREGLPCIIFANWRGFSGTAYCSIPQNRTPQMPLFLSPFRVMAVQSPSSWIGPLLCSLIPNHIIFTTHHTTPSLHRWTEGHVR